MGTLIGLIIGVVAVVVAMFFKEVSFDVFINPAAIFVIFVGTAGAVTVSTPINELKNLPKLFGVVFGKDKGLSVRSAIDKLTEFASLARKEGLLALEPRVGEIDDPFMKRGAALLVDGCEPEMIRKILNEDIEAMEDRHAAGANIFSQAGAYAPTLGVLGAVLGLIAALGHMDDTEALGHAISAAFIATVLGIFTGYVLWHPIANKLKRMSAQEVHVKTLVMEGLIGMSEGVNARMLAELLNSMVAVGERAGQEGGE
ncbi:MAG: flagellar motor stator protein MotA [Clostridiales bacterium]|jgi:chemotaxis protein MotA|nr:flagellar motor stator protein MotA [Clostridiales bacterium]